MAFNLAEYWQEAVAAGVAVVAALPARLVWKRAMNAVQKEEFLAAIEAINDRHDARSEEEARRVTGIFRRLDEVAKSTARIEGYIQAQQDHKA